LENFRIYSVVTGKYRNHRLSQRHLGVLHSQQELSFTQNPQWALSPGGHSATIKKDFFLCSLVDDLRGKFLAPGFTEPASGKAKKSAARSKG